MLQTANKTRDLAANTLEELQRQGDKLEVIDQDLHAVSHQHTTLACIHFAVST